MSEIAFVELKPRDVASGAEVTIRLAGGGSETPYRHLGEHWRAGIVEMPRFRAAIGFDENGWTGGTVPVSGALNFMPADGALVAELATRYWRDAPVTIDAGEEGTALARRLTGSVADMASDEGQLSFTLVDPSRRLDKPLLGTGFAGTGGIEGPSEATGRAKRRSWGRVFNVEGELLDKANNIYEFGDPARPLQAIDALRDKGRAGPITVLNWQGSVAATFSALQAAIALEGGGVVAPSIACAKWWTVPAGPLTADLRGETAGGYSANAVTIAARVLSAVGGPAIISQAAAEALRTAECGIHVASAGDTAAQALDRLLLGISLGWVLQPDGQVRIFEFAWKPPAAALNAIFIGRERQLPPVKSRKVGYRRNHRQHSASEISAALLLASDAAYADGTPIEALKPAQAGADVTSTNTAAAIANQGALATKNQASWGAEVSGRPAELTDGRVSAGLSSDGSAQKGVYAGGAVSVPIAVFMEAGLLGKSLSLDADFSRLTIPSSYVIYNNSGGDDVSMALVTDGSAPNGSSRVLRVSYDGGGVSSPGFGGVAQLLLPSPDISRPGYYSSGTKVLYSIRAKIPAGRTLELHSNSLGDFGSLVWLTPNGGTGAWETYLALITIGATGSLFSSTGFIAVHGGANIAFSWDIALYDQRELGTQDLPQLTRLVDPTGVIRTGGELITAQGTAAAISGQSPLAAGNSLTPGEVTNSALAPSIAAAATTAEWTGVSSRPTTLGALDSAAGTKLGGIEAGADVTAGKTAAAIVGQGLGATANNLEDLDPAAAAAIAGLGGGGDMVVGYGQVIKRLLANGASRSLSGAVGVNAGGSSGTLRARIEVSPAGANSWTLVQQGSGVSVGAGEPGQDTVSGTYTNTTGLEQLFDFRIFDGRTPGTAGGTINNPQTYLVG